MVISSDEAIAKAREFANKVGWMTEVKDVSLVPAVWKVRLEGEFDIVTIELDVESGEVLKSESFHIADD